MRDRSVLSLLLLLFLGACTHQPVSDTHQPVFDTSATLAPAKDEPRVLHKIAFGSCNKLTLPQPLWRKLIEEKPDLWIWTGDVIYADTRNPKVLSTMYDQQLHQPEYAGFLASGIPVIGTYDDHDYGERDGGKSFPIRDLSKQYFLDFLNEPQDSPRRHEPGIYTSYRFGSAGQRVKILLTDNRYNRDEPGANGDILGEPQWQWLEREMQTVDADLLVLVSGTQVLPYEHKYEKWADWPKARDRMIQTLDRSPYKNLLIISGDRHLGELSQFALPSGKKIWEVTSSGLTHSYKEANDSVSPNRLRVGPMLTRLNYGILNIDWDGATPKVSVEVRDINKEPIIHQDVLLQK